MSFHLYSYGTCDFCGKEIDSKNIKKLNQYGYNTYHLPVICLYPSSLPSWREYKGFQEKTYELCDECSMKVAKLLYDEYGWYYEQQERFVTNS